jgi:hypothetical protein
LICRLDGQRSFSLSPFSMSSDEASTGHDVQRAAGHGVAVC